MKNKENNSTNLFNHMFVFLAIPCPAKVERMLGNLALLSLNQPHLPLQSTTGAPLCALHSYCFQQVNTLQLLWSALDSPNLLITLLFLFYPFSLLKSKETTIFLVPSMHHLHSNSASLLLQMTSRNTSLV